MKIATFNINNVKRRLPVLLRWLTETGPDVVCLQELKAADREFPQEALEEAGYGARRVQVLRGLTLAPTYMSHVSWLVLARDLYPEKLPGDEPEELEVIPWKLQDLEQLMLRDDFSEGRSLAALFIARAWLAGR